ncbi:SH3 domain-containing protein [Allochromatium palmeri]|uniref:SH3 domain-containing protein n=1 Tax=Allochromatium palmeri TaxID=231048 RepID=A0A6N8EI83_9GAMM|nr:SH3 domain-containing protein [Allochromatium palmeri]MTW22609.1 hypothetical protein [Allochromatium palmeri]
MHYKISLLALGLLSVALTASVQATGDWCANPIKTDDGFLNLRLGPGTTYAIVGRAIPSDELVIDTAQCRNDFGEMLCDESGKWVFVQYINSVKEASNIQKGWVNSRFVQQVQCKND